MPVPQEAQDKYREAEARATDAYNTIMLEAPKRATLTAPCSPEYTEFVKRATVAYEAIEAPARAERDAQWTD